MIILTNLFFLFQKLARKLQEEEELSADSGDRPRLNDQEYLDHKIALEAQDAEFARLLQEKERQKAKRAKERARQRKLERQQLQQQQQQIQHQHQSSQDSNDGASSLEGSQRPIKLDLKHSSRKTRTSSHSRSQHSDPEEIRPCDEPEEEVATPETPQKNVATMIDPTYNGNNTFKSTTSAEITCSPEALPLDNSGFSIIPGQRRSTTAQSPNQSLEEKQKRRVKDGCKQQ